MLFKMSRNLGELLLRSVSLKPERSSSQSVAKVDQDVLAGIRLDRSSAYALGCSG